MKNNFKQCSLVNLLGLNFAEANFWLFAQIHFCGWAVLCHCFLTVIWIKSAKKAYFAGTNFRGKSHNPRKLIH